MNNEFIVSLALDPGEVIFGPVKHLKDVFKKFSNQAKSGNTVWFLNARTNEADEIGFWEEDLKTGEVVYVEV